jgi:hypothetical protein
VRISTTRRFEMSNNTPVYGGISFTGMLTIIFVVLKLTKTIDWSWGWVLAPLWIPAAIFLIVVIVAAFLAVMGR